MPYIIAMNAIIYIEEVKLSGFGGSLTISMANSDFTNLKSNISAAEGYTMTVSDVSYDGKGFYSYTWKVH